MEGGGGAKKGEMHISAHLKWCTALWWQKRN